MSLSDDQVRRIARLARLEIEPQEVAPVAARLNRVLGLIEQAVTQAKAAPLPTQADLLTDVYVKF